MNIYFNQCFYSISAFRERFTSSLTPQQKRIVAIASLALSLVAANYLLFRCIYKKQKIASTNIEIAKTLPIQTPTSAIQQAAPPIPPPESNQQEIPPRDKPGEVIEPLPLPPISEIPTTLPIAPPDSDKHEMAPSIDLKKIVENLSFGPHSSENEKIWIQKTVLALLKHSQVLKWEPMKNGNEYQIELSQGIILGNHPEVSYVQLILKKEIHIAFSEEMNPKTNLYRQIITFPNKGVCFRVVISIFSKDIAPKIAIEENMSTIEGMGGAHEQPVADFTLGFLGNLKLITE